MEVSQSKYLYVSPNVNVFIDSSIDILKTKGLSHMAEITEENDKKGLLTFEAKLASMLYTIPMPERKTIHYSYDYKLKSPQGSHIRVLQQNYYLNWNEEGVPMIKVGLVEDISFLKKDGKQLCKVSVGTAHTYWASNGIRQRIEEVSGLSKRQLEVLELLNKGLGSHEIAQELSISTHTVDNHRRSMLDKFCVKDTTALLWLARTWDILQKPNGTYTTKGKQLVDLIYG
jgi:DNA-binding CsgD family transcriptional regulator